MSFFRHLRPYLPLIALALALIILVSAIQVTRLLLKPKAAECTGQADGQACTFVDCPVCPPGQLHCPSSPCITKPGMCLNQACVLNTCTSNTDCPQTQTCTNTTCQEIVCALTVPDCKLQTIVNHQCTLTNAPNGTSCTSGTCQNGECSTVISDPECSLVLGGTCRPNCLSTEEQIAGSTPNAGCQTATICCKTASSANLDLTFKLQGVTSAYPIPLVTFRLNTPDSSPTSTPITHTTNGIHQASLTTLPLQTTTLYIKGPAHLQKKFPLTLTPGANSLDVTSTPLLAGDFNNDNLINAVDLGLLLANYTALVTPVTSTNQLYDVNADGMITITDISLVLSNYTALTIHGD